MTVLKRPEEAPSVQVRHAEVSLELVAVVLAISHFVAFWIGYFAR